MVAVTTDPLERLPVRVKIGLVGEILRSYVAMRSLMRSNGVPATVDSIRDGAFRCSAPSAEVAEEIGARLGRVVGRTLSVLPADSRCLVRALVLFDLLARRGIHSSLVIGVRSEPVFGAHAWVEYRGHPLQPTGAFRRLTEL